MTEKYTFKDNKTQYSRALLFNPLAAMRVAGDPHLGQRLSDMRVAGDPQLLVVMNRWALAHNVISCKMHCGSQTVEKLKGYGMQIVDFIYQGLHEKNSAWVDSVIMSAFNLRRVFYVFVRASHATCGHMLYATVRCRCYEYGIGTAFGRRDFMSREKIEDWSEKHRKNLYLYLEKGPGIREVIFFSERAKCKPKYFSQSKFLSLEPIGRQTVDDVQYAGDIAFVCQEGASTASSNGASETGMEGGRGRKRARPDTTLEAAVFIANLAWEKWYTSVNSLFNEPKVVVKYGDYHLIKNRKELKELTDNAINTKFAHIFEMRFLDFKSELFKEPRVVSNPILGRSTMSQLFGNKFGKVMSIEDSSDVYIRLLKQNCGEMGPKRFFMQLVEWFDRELGKKKCYLFGRSK